jgi:Holliday junction resolvasome RuvABC endonuclease subunit
MIVVGLDLSLTSTGIAILRDGELAAPLRSVGHTSRDGANFQNRSRRVRSQCQAVLDQVIGKNRAAGLWPDLAVLEGPEAFDTFGHAFDRGALWHGVYGALDAKRVPVAVVNPKTLKVWWVGDGNASKLRMLNAAMARVRPAVSTHDEADALALACAGAWHLGDPVPFEPNERQVESLDKVAWPVSA